MPLARLYPYAHSPIKCYFKPSPRDFVVKEVPLYEPSGDGEHCIIYVRKKGLSTFELLALLSNVLGCKVRDIGYAGLKDKAASTYQYISIHRTLSEKLTQNIDFLREKHIKILDIKTHRNKLKIGHLKGNRFFVRLKKCDAKNAHKLQSLLPHIAQQGFPNYFGSQRFGIYKDNYLQGRALAHGEKQMRDKKLRDFLLSSYQSHLFNQWLIARVMLSKILYTFPAADVLVALTDSSLHMLREFATKCDKKYIESLQKQKQYFVLVNGDVMCHYPFGKAFICKDTQIESARFNDRDIAPTGALFGTKCIRASDNAAYIESFYEDSALKANGQRRFAWVWAEDIQWRYIPENAHFELHFTLPKGAYATILLECLLGTELENAHLMLDTES